MVVVVACLIIVSTSGPDSSRLRLSLCRLVTRSIKTRYGNVGDQVRQVGQGQGQELEKSFLVGWGGRDGGLFDFSVNLWPRFIKIKAKFGQISDQVN